MDSKRRTNEGEEREDWIPASLDGTLVRIHPEVTTVRDLREWLEIRADRELVRVVETDEEIAPGTPRLGVSSLGDPEEPVVVSGGDEFFTRPVQDPENDPDPVSRDAVESVVETFQRLAEANRDSLPDDPEEEWTEQDTHRQGAANAYEDAWRHIEAELLGRWTGVEDPRTADAVEWLADSATGRAVDTPAFKFQGTPTLTVDGEEHVLENLELQSVSLVPAEEVEGFGGGVIRPKPDEEPEVEDDEEDENVARLREWADRKEENGELKQAEYLRDLADASEALQRNGPDYPWRS